MQGIIRESSSRSVAFRHPLASLAFYAGIKNPLHRAIIIESAAYLFGKKHPASAWKQALREIEGNELLPQNENKNNLAVGNSLNTTFGKWIYCCVRVLQPEIMIETGVSHGSSSWIILNAIHKNGKGRLYSIDLPDNDTHAAYNFQDAPRTGWIVPEVLKPHWELHLGDAKKLLPEILQKTHGTDIFFHDSDHSYGHMKYEFETVLPFIRPNGIILSDDVHKNDAFSEFITANKLKALQFNKGGCACR